ncbi:MAG: hypothetical protein JKY51_01840 [Opitutaceae bacterium]|nr:hypothetical protein [Opitutaceae bacterium]
MSCSTFSQGLKPIVQQIDTNIVFCFTISQSKEIAKRIASGAYKDSIATRLELESSRLFLVTQKQDSTIYFLELKQGNMNTMSQNQKVHIGLLNNTINDQQHKIKRSRFHKILLGVGMGIMTVIAISK